MAFFNDLVRVIAESEGMDEMTVRGIGLSVREAGYISKGGRGLSAARMGVADAANLLIGVNGSTTSKDAGSIVGTYREMPLTDRIGMKKAGKGVLSTGSNLGTGFGIYLEKILSLYALNDDIGPEVIGALDAEGTELSEAARSGRIDDHLVLEVVFSKPDPAADVFFKMKGRGINYGQVWFSGVSRVNSGDRRDTTTISSLTLRNVALTLVK